MSVTVIDSGLSIFNVDFSYTTIKKNNLQNLTGGIFIFINLC